MDKKYVNGKQRAANIPFELSSRIDTMRENGIEDSKIFAVLFQEIYDKVSATLALMIKKHLPSGISAAKKYAEFCIENRNQVDHDTFLSTMKHLARNVAVTTAYTPSQRGRDSNVRLLQQILFSIDPPADFIDELHDTVNALSPRKGPLYQNGLNLRSAQVHEAINFCVIPRKPLELTNR